MATLFVACAPPALVDTENVGSASESALETYSAARGNRIADRALALWNGKPSRNLCLAGVGDTLETSGVVSPAFLRLPSAVAFDDWARANPAELTKRGFMKMNVALDAIPRGSIITWRPGQCGYHSVYGHIEIVADNASSRACSDYCGTIYKSCGAPGIFVPVGPAPGTPPMPEASCSVAAKRLQCTNRPDTQLRAEPKVASEVVNVLRTTDSWFECWGKGEADASGNSTWYRTVGDDNSTRGWAPSSALDTTDTFDADPSVKGLPACESAAAP